MIRKKIVFVKNQYSINHDVFFMSFFIIFLILWKTIEKLKKLFLIKLILVSEIISFF
jgi:hypothetical protein